MSAKKGEEDTAMKETAQAVRQHAKSGVALFPLSSDFPQERTVYWDGKDVQEFVRLAIHMESPALYLREDRVDDDDDEWKAHAGELWRVQVGFLHEGIFHVFERATRWAEEAVAEQDEDDEETEDRFFDGSKEAAEKVKSIVGMEEEIVKAFLGTLFNGVDTVDPSKAAFRSRFKEFLARHLELSDDYALYSVARHDSEAAKVIDGLVQLAIVTLRDSEMKNLENFVSECIHWARRNSMKSVTQSDVDVYLAEEKVQLSRETKRLLWQKVNFALKTSRVPG